MSAEFSPLAGHLFGRRALAPRAPNGVRDGRRTGPKMSEDQRLRGAQNGTPFRASGWSAGGPVELGTGGLTLTPDRLTWNRVFWPISGSPGSLGQARFRTRFSENFWLRFGRFRARCASLVGPFSGSIFENLRGRIRPVLGCPRERFRAFASKCQPEYKLQQYKSTG